MATGVGPTLTNKAREINMTVDVLGYLEKVRDKAIDDIDLFNRGFIHDGDSTQILAWYTNALVEAAASKCWCESLPSDLICDFCVEQIRT